jgi:hypothetical protein
MRNIAPAKGTIQKLTGATTNDPMVPGLLLPREAQPIIPPNNFPPEQQPKNPMSRPSFPTGEQRQPVFRRGTKPNRPMPTRCPVNLGGRTTNRIR